MSEEKAVAIAPATSGELAINPLSELSDAEWKDRLEGAARAVKRLHDLYERVMVEEVHYGTIPGTPKATLYKAGAELIFKLFGCAPVYERLQHYGDGSERPPITAHSICRAHHVATGCYLAEGAGSCNSWERKYRWRNAQRVCPECGVAAIIKGSAQYGGGFVCWKKKDGCGSKFADDDKRITEQMAGQLENPDPFDQENTIVKIGDKRAYVACALTLGGASGFFNQDLDDRDERTDDAPAAAPTDAGPAIDAGKQQMLRDMAVKRAKALKLEGEDAGHTLLNEVLKKQGYAKIEEVTLGHLNLVLQAIAVYELPK
jgi:hypothetical protein